MIILSSTFTSNHFPALRPKSMQTLEWYSTSNYLMSVIRSVISFIYLFFTPKNMFSSSRFLFLRLSMMLLIGTRALVRSLTVLKLTFKYFFFRPERWLISYKSVFSITSTDYIFSILDSMYDCTYFSIPVSNPT